YEDPQWEQRLRGGLRLQGKEFIYEEDVLFNALQTGKKIMMANPPKNNHAYHRFIQGLLKEEKLKEINFLKKDFSFHSGYDWNALREQITFEKVDSQHFYTPNKQNAPYLLTPQGFQQLLSHHYCDEEGYYYQEQGLLEQAMATGKPFPLLLGA